MPKNEEIELEDGFLFKTDEVPPQVKRAASAYRKALTEKNDAQGTLNTKKAALIDAMQEHDCQACMVEVDGVRKVVRLAQEDKIKIEKPVEAPAAGE